ncbi:MAG: hypothetical protein ABJB39_06165 [Chloroflexota bacterium]
MNDAVVRISRRSLLWAVGGLAAALLLLALVVTGVVARAADANTVASASVMKTQQDAAERDIERAYEQAVTQVHKVRALNLAITAAQADAITLKALNDLKALRHSGLVSLGQVLGLAAADGEATATAAEKRFDQAPLSAQPAPSPVLLAPRLYAIAARMSELATQLSDQATAAVTAPAATPAPTAAPSPSRTPAPPASPSGRP